MNDRVSLVVCFHLLLVFYCSLNWLPPMEGTHSYGFGRSEAIILRLDFLVKISQGWTKALAGYVPFWKLCGKHISRCLQGIGRIYFLSMLSTWHLHLQVSNSWWSPAHLPSATFLFLNFFFFMWTIFKVFIEFTTILLLFPFGVFSAMRHLKS